jgi:hypothetical protein
MSTIGKSITHVAVVYNGTTYSLPPPNRHAQVLWLINETNEHNYPNEEGFLDSEGKFLNRKEAMKIAVASGQLRRREGAQYYQGPDLYSEDLW